MSDLGAPVDSTRFAGAPNRPTCCCPPVPTTAKKQVLASAKDGSGREQVQGTTTLVGTQG